LEVVVQIELFDDAQKPRPAQNLLSNALKPYLQVIADVRSDDLFWNRGLLHQNESARLITRWQNPTDSPDRHPTDKQRYQKMQMPAACDSQIALKVKAFSFLVQIVNHDYLPSGFEN